MPAPAKGTQDQVRPLHKIAREISASWPNPNYAAAPYIEAMGRLNLITDSYGHDTAKGVVVYFLSNAGSWRGDTAKRIKAELRRMVAAAR
jgi:hypothetical protein